MRFQNLLLAVCVLLSGTAAQAATPEDNFRQHCASCHTIGGGDLTGPDLKGVLARKDRAWLQNFITDPARVLASGDPYAIELQRKARGAVMPTLPAITPAVAADLLALIEAESAKEVSAFRGAAANDRPVLPADIQAGHDLFTGVRPLASGGPACMTCHDLARLPHLGGGRLGPNLDQASARLGGRKAVLAWLGSPPSPTMTPIYKDRPLSEEEIFALAAYLEETAKRMDAPPSGAGLLGFAFAGLVGAGALLGAIDLAWKGRLHG